MGPWTWLIPLGFVVGAYGTLIGAGGGFVLVPVLLLIYPEEAPQLITSISLAVVFFNATSGSIAYARLKRIDYRSGLLFAAATVPGAVLGALTTEHIPRRLFNGVFGVVLIAISVYLLIRPKRESAARGRCPAGHTTRTIVDSEGVAHTFTFRPWVGVVLSLFVGYLSSLLGIGGGIIHVPALVHLLNYPAHIATATSHFILAIMALTGTGVHVATGDFSSGVLTTLYLGVGALVGAQLGAKLSTRLRGVWILRGLAIALGFVGIRILFMAF